MIGPMTVSISSRSPTAKRHWPRSRISSSTAREATAIGKPRTIIASWNPADAVRGRAVRSGAAVSPSTPRPGRRNGRRATSSSSPTLVGIAGRRTVQQHLRPDAHASPGLFLACPGRTGGRDAKGGAPGCLAAADEHRHPPHRRGGADQLPGRRTGYGYPRRPALLSHPGYRHHAL